MFNVVYLAVEIDSHGMFNDFLMTNKIISRYEELEKYADMEEFDIFLRLPVSDKEKVIRQFARYNTEVLEIHWKDSGLDSENICVLCKKKYFNYGNNAQPLAEGRCCDECNMDVVVARMKKLNQ